MTFRKILTIAWKDVRATFTDRNLILIMLAAPLMISTIIGLTFGGVSQGAAPVTDVPVAVVNLDPSTDANSASVILANVLAPLPSGAAGDAGEPGTSSDLIPNAGAFVCPEAADSANAQGGGASLDTLLDTTRVATAEEARAGVDSGLYTVAVIIPADLSANVGFSAANLNLKPSQIEVYANPAKPIAASIVRSIVQQVSQQIATGNVALSAIIAPLITTNPLSITNVTASDAFTHGIACAFAGVGSPISIEQQTVTGADFVFNPLVVIGSAQAIFFAIFTANGSASSTIEERLNGTLQRMAISPTPMVAILTGKMLATFLNVLFQLVFLMISLTLVNTLIYGRLEFIWGSNIPLVLVILVTIALATTGLGAITAAAARNPEQATTIGSLVAIFSAVLGGAFGFQLGGGIQYLSVVYWGSNAFSELAVGNNDIWLNALVMTLFGAVTFGIGFVIFARRLRD